MKQHIKNSFVTITVATVLSGACINPALAAASTDGKWNHMLAPLFLWGMSIDGESQIGPVTEPLQIEFKDAVSDLEAVFTIHYEAKKDALSLIGEYQFSSDKH